MKQLIISACKVIVYPSKYMTLWYFIITVTGCDAESILRWGAPSVWGTDVYNFPTKIKWKLHIIFSNKFTKALLVCKFGNLAFVWGNLLSFLIHQNIWCYEFEKYKLFLKTNRLCQVRSEFISLQAYKNFEKKRNFAFLQNPRGKL